MIYIICPANYATGGPELLHQLGYKLRLLGFPAVMYYLNAKEDVCPVCETYQRYNVPYVEGFVDNAENLVIAAESYLSLLRQAKAATRVLWWLSVDNAKIGPSDEEMLKTDRSIIHLVQSHYAREFVGGVLGIEESRVFYLSDYINSTFFTRQPSELREDTVLFNPKKGFEVTAKLIERSDARVKWQALNGLTPEEMKKVMHRAKVYVDVGAHPGKDRIPREAALCGLCVITNRQGAAANNIDVPIPGQYKFSSEASIGEVLQAIYDLIRDYPGRCADYEGYAKKIKREFIEFEKDIVNCIEPLTGRRLPTCASAEEYLEAILECINQGDIATALQHLVKYRVDGYPESAMLALFESTIRMLLGELEEAYYCALQGIGMEEADYELYFCLTQICHELKRDDEVEKFGRLAIQYSQGSEDAEYIQQACSQWMSV